MYLDRAFAGRSSSTFTTNVMRFWWGFDTWVICNTYYPIDSRYIHIMYISTVYFSGRQHLWFWHLGLQVCWLTGCQFVSMLGLTIWKDGRPFIVLYRKCICSEGHKSRTWVRWTLSVIGLKKWRLSDAFTMSASGKLIHYGHCK